MANDRVFIVCERCGAVEVLTKYYPSHGAHLEGDQPTKLTRFYADHIDCTPTEQDLGPCVLFSIMGEDELFRRGGPIKMPTRGMTIPPLNPLSHK